MWSILGFIFSRNVVAVGQRRRRHLSEGWPATTHCLTVRLQSVCQGNQFACVRPFQDAHNHDNIVHRVDNIGMHWHSQRTALHSSAKRSLDNCTFDQMLAPKNTFARVCPAVFRLVVACSHTEPNLIFHSGSSNDRMCAAKKTKGGNALAGNNLHI